ncbi:PREDICTED: uncharacterized protein LOC104714772 [Camelina sativa]|uniref:Uncharacterized protein LOC104714772 n=1 Tax=Camelina sativa TaxID=90675 RepID=A0ABM0TSD4_CAMSA|nr:PREDICTED: uncharacterized protein LOC104714772 [Camelina sativa]
MSLRRVCEMQYKIAVPQERFWDRFVDNETCWANIKVTVDHQTKTMKQRFVKSNFVKGYKLIAATTKVSDDESSGLNCIIDITAEYEKSGLEIKDLEEVQFLVGSIKEAAFLCPARVGDDIPVPVRLK